MRQQDGSAYGRSWVTRLWLIAYALVGVLAAACGAGRPNGNTTPTVISQPTPDRTVDAVVRGLVTVAPNRPPGTGGPTTPGTSLATAPAVLATPRASSPGGGQRAPARRTPPRATP